MGGHLLMPGLVNVSRSPDSASRAWIDKTTHPNRRRSGSPFGSWKRESRQANLESVLISNQTWRQLYLPLYLPPASSGDQNRGSGCLDFLPLFNSRTIKAPVASDSEARKPALAKQPVNSRGMHPQMVRELFYGEYFVLSGHRNAPRASGVD
jgi:hypothetical protein